MCRYTQKIAVNVPEELWILQVKIQILMVADDTTMA